MNELKSLLPKTKIVLVLLSELPMMKHFTFVGGSALAVYLNHRLSEDLDFFSAEKELNSKEILENIYKIKDAEIAIINSSKTQIDLFVNKVKVTFFANDWIELKNGKKLINSINIAPLDLLVIMKVNTLFLRAKYRDYYDLYVLNKTNYTLAQMFLLSKNKLKGISIKLFQTALVFTDDIADESIKHLKPQYRITLKKMAEHFETNIKQWNNLSK